MVRPPLHVHCELAPVLVNRTAAYRMCRTIPPALAERGFRVSCSALLARVATSTVKPVTTRERRLFERSRRWLLWAADHPGWFAKTCRLTGLRTRWRHKGGIQLFLDPLYIL